MNRHKIKGDRAERELVAHVIATYPNLVDEPAPMRMLGAGRLDDEGDARLFTDVAVQVKFYNDVSRALRLGMDGARRQAVNARKPIGVGFVKVPRNRKVPWLAVCAVDAWPVPDSPFELVGLASKALDLIQEDRSRIIDVGRQGCEVMRVAALPAWMAALAQRRNCRGAADIVEVR